MGSQTIRMIAVMLLALSTSRAQGVKEDLRVLTAGQSTEREIAGGEAHSYQIHIGTAQYLNVVVEQRGIDVVVTLFAPDRKKISEVDSPNGAFGPEVVLAITETAGEYRVEVRPLEAKAVAGSYEIKIRELRAAREEDKSRISTLTVAREARTEASQLRDKGSPEALRVSIEKYQRALILWRRIGDQYWEAYSLYNIGALYDSLGEKQKALEFYNQALLLRRAIGDRPGEASTLNVIGAVYDSLGENQKAVEYFNQALPLRRAVGDRRGEAKTLNDLGRVYDSFGEEQKALGFFNQALPIDRAAGNRVGEAATLNNIGHIYYSLGEKRKALELYNQVLLLCRAVGDRSGEAITLSEIGAVNSYLGEKQKALEFYHQALPLRRAVGDRRGEATTLNGIALVYSSLGEEQKALGFFNQALPIFRAAGDRGGEAGTLVNIGGVYKSLGENQKALELFNRALPIFRAEGTRGSEATTLNNIGLVYDSIGEKQKALEFYNQSLPLCREVGDRGGEAITLNNIGEVYHSLGEKQQALKFLNQALPLFRAVGDRSGEAAVLRNLMDSWNTSNGSLAIFFGKQAVNTLQQLRANIRALEKELQQTFLHSNEDTYRTLADLLISQGRLVEAQQVLGLLKEHEYFEFVRRDAEAASLTGVHISFTAAEAELEKRFSEIADHIAEIGAQRSALLAIKIRVPEQEKRLSELEAQLEIANQAFQKFLDQLEVELKKTRPGGNDIGSLRESQAFKDTLRELDAIALYTIVGPDKYNVILITPDVEKAYEYKIRETDLNKKVFAFREALQNPDADPLPLAQELYRILIGPELARDIAQTKKQTVLWSLDGTLRYLPMAALHDGQKYLVESYRNVVITLASHDHLRDPVSPAWQALGLGVSKGLVLDAGSNAALIFSPLPGVREELSSIVRDETRGAGQKGVLPGTVMLDEDFTADKMKIALRLRGNDQPYKLVHIASHFNFEPGDETKSFLLLGGGKTLTLSQLKSMSQVFSRVELLTLSACNTATGGEANGKEVEGFAVLAQRQGAQAIIASLWPVSDPSTSQLMQQFYRLHDDPGISKAEAMRQAQLNLLHPEGQQPISDDKMKRNNQTPFKADSKAPYSHPYFWAPFILIGNWR